MKTVIRDCEWCKESFVAKQKYVNRGRGRFCTISCASKYKNSFIPKGTSRSRLGVHARSAYLAFYSEIVCIKCSAKKADVHHIDMDKTNNSKENLQGLCRSCHTTGHNILRGKKVTAPVTILVCK